MYLTHAGLLVVAILLIGLMAMGVAGAAVALARWDGHTVPASLSRGAIAFAGTVTLGASLAALFLALR